TSPWSSQNNSIWNLHMCCLLPAETYGGGATTSADFVYSWEESQALGSITIHRNYLSAECHTKWMGNQPAQVFTDPIYTLEEVDQYNDTINTCKSYVNECIASFALGQLDPNSDADWETYKANIESAGLQQWLDLAQTYWDRSH
ncbi:MAG: hypothetical protein J5602_13865, partial [Clostridia bacterium]|nr:hypothetical protein [Clostridia bacterium]